MVTVSLIIQGSSFNNKFLKEQLSKIAASVFLFLQSATVVCHDKLNHVYSDWLTLNSVEIAGISEKEKSKITDLHKGSSFLSVANYLLNQNRILAPDIEIKISLVELLPLKVRIEAKKKDPRFLIDYQYGTAKRKSWVTDENGVVVGNVDDYVLEKIEQLPRVEFIFSNNPNSLELGFSNNTLFKVGLDYLKTKVDIQGLSRFVVRSDGTITVLADDGPNIIVPISDGRPLSFYMRKSKEIMKDLYARGETSSEIDFTYSRQVIVRGAKPLEPKTIEN